MLIYNSLIGSLESNWYCELFPIILISKVKTGRSFLVSYLYTLTFIGTFYLPSTV